MTTEFKLRFNENKINYWASRYDEESDAKMCCLKQKIEMKEQKSLTKKNLCLVGHWKFPFLLKRWIKRNDEKDVEKITSKVFTSNAEKEKIEELIKLHGVGMPVASVILHWFAKEEYPILDWRALESLSIEKDTVNYDYSFWRRYTEFCREIAARNNITMRTLDRALWQYSSENPPPKRLKVKEKPDN